MEKTLSIIIPTYNMEKYLDKCLTSLIVDDEELMNQLQVLVIIDGAKDHSSEIAHLYQDRYPQTFIVIDKENGNYGSCINRGLKVATGKYVKILDADDSYDTTIFKDYLSILTKENADLILNDFDIVDAKDTVRRTHRYKIEPLSQLSFEKYCRTNLLALEMHSVAYRLSIFDGLNYYQTEGISYTDQEWVFLPVTKVETVFYFNKSLYKYLVGREGQTVDPAILVRSITHTEKGLYSMMKVFESIKSSCSGVKLYYLRNKLFNRVLSLYTQILIMSSANYESLIDIDNNIKRISIETWNLCNNITYMGYPFVKKWRDCHYVMKLPLYIKVHLFAKKMYNKLKILFS